MRFATLLLAALLVGCTSHADGPPASECRGRTLVLDVDLSRCNWVKVDAGAWSCHWDGGP